MMSGVCRWALLVLAFVGLGVAHAETTEKRVALVVGVGHYANTVALTNPPNDARLIASSLEKLNFQVQTVIDPDYDGLKDALREFGRRLDGAKVALFYYAGHGIEVAGKNYLLPTNAALAREPDLRLEAFDVEAVLDEMDGSGRINLVFLDACRDNPLSHRLSAHMGSRSAAVGQGLASEDTHASGMLIAYSTAPGTIAADGDGQNSPFAASLARHIGTPGLGVDQIIRRVRGDVLEATNGKQNPWHSENMISDFYFVPKAPEPPQTPNPGTVSAEVVFWQSIANSTSAAEFEAYLQQFPQGTYAALARVRLAALSAKPAPAPDGEEPGWTVADRQAVQAALTTLGFYRGKTDGAFSADTRAAIRQWQAFTALAETAHLTAEQRDRVLQDAERQKTLLAVPTKSPRGVAADSVKGGEARFNRASDFERGGAQPKDLAEAVYWYALAAGDGWAAAFTNLGTLYARGQGVEKPDLDSARRLWMTAAVLGEGTAMFNLGVLAEKGLGITADPALAKRWYSRGAERKNGASGAALQRLGG